jgi:hypothetical protein
VLLKIGHTSIFTLSILLIAGIFSQTAAAISEDLLVETINQHRTEQDTPRLAANKKLQASAKSKAHDMCANKYWGHVSPDNVTPWDHIKAQNLVYEVAGENLAASFSTTEGVFNAWDKSPAHNKTMFDSRFTDVGIYTQNCTIGKTIHNVVIAHFALPRHTTDGLQMINELKSILDHSSLTILRTIHPSQLEQIASEANIAS